MDSTVRMGTLTWDEFRTQCWQLVAASSNHRDTWVLRTIPKDDHEDEDEPGHSYLEKRITCLTATLSATEDAVAMPTSSAAEDLALEEVEDAEAPQESDVQTASVVQGVTDDLVTREYHVLYSLSYSVPVLYFNVWKRDGSLAPLDDIWRQVPLAFADDANKWGTITQQEHPLLGRPYFYIHPCQTENLMKNCQNNLKISNYLITWLSMFGPIVGLEIQLSYAF